jgi:ATP-dependent DNA ligase
MDLPLQPGYPPMEAKSVEHLPEDLGWQYEPKWDGFRCIAFRDGAEVELRSKSGQPLARYFPDVAALIAAAKPRRFVLDGELVIPVAGQLDFEELQLRLHPAASRVEKLSRAHPASYILFDLLVESGRSLADQPLEKRRPRLEAFFAALDEPRLLLSPATRDVAEARRWCEEIGQSLDGLIAKRLDLPYRSGERDGAVKWKRLKTADCVVGGFRYGTASELVGSLLLGLYDEEGLLNHVGYTSTIPAKEKPELTRRLEALRKPPGFTGRAPGGPSRWSTERSGEWEALAPKLVVEVRYDHVSGERFRHGTALLRWRPDKAPRQCTMEQIRPQGAGGYADLLAKAGS